MIEIFSFVAKYIPSTYIYILIYINMCCVFFMGIRSSRQFYSIEEIILLHVS